MAIARRGRRLPTSVKPREIGSVLATPGSGRGETRGLREFNNLPRIIEAFPEACASIVEETAADVATDATSDAPIGPTGRLRRSARIRKLRVSSRGFMQRIDFRVERAPGEEGRAHQYPFYVEVGTADTPAQPFVVPAIMKNRPRFTDKLRRLEDRLPR